jgi:ATP-dependent DNA helicase RecG
MKSRTPGTAIDEFVENILSLEEGQRIEFKRAGKNDRALDSMVAFANAGGGVVLLGIEDPKKATGHDRLYGADENPEAVDELQRLVRNRITPLLSPPVVEEPVFRDVPCTLRDGKPGRIVFIQVNQSAAVHSIVGGATLARFGRTNQQLSAAEITDLSLRRGTRSVVDDPVAVSFDLLDTATWRQYAESRRITRALPEALRHVGLAKVEAGGRLSPTRAAVLLFAEEPNGLLDSKCTVRVFHYKGDRVEHSATTNLVRPPRTAGGPLIEQIRAAVDLTVDALASGIQVGPLGFEIVQKYPLRVIREAITNAVIHRDYRHSADIQIRIFDDHIEIESPGAFPGRVNARNIAAAGSQPRNRSLADHLREFPSPPNLDAGEGVRMMISVMDKAKLYAPTFLAPPDLPREAVLTLLRNEARPTAWTQVEARARESGSVGNAEVRAILRSDDSVRASKMLRLWVDAGLLVPVDPGSAKKDRRYRLPGQPPQPDLFPISNGSGN